MMGRIARLSVLAVAVPMGALAQTPRGSHAIGAGSLPCSDWTVARGANRALEEGAWVLGFLSGFGSAWLGRPEKVDPLNAVTADEIFSWMDNYCEARPRDPITRAALAFV